MVADALLSAEGLQRRYGARLVLDVDRLDVRQGEVLAIVGPNGAGKSTLFRTLLLLERPDAGTVRLEGEVMTVRDRRARGRLAGVFQRPVLFTGSVRSNVEFGLEALGLAAQERGRRSGEALEWLELSELADASVHELSGGEAQRVALARALVLRPAVLLLDEPTANLDVAVRRRFRHDLETAARARAGAVVLVTHDAAEAFGLADRVAVMQDGRIVQEGTPDEIVLRPASPFAAELTGAELLLHGIVENVEDGLVALRVAKDMVLWAGTGAGSLVRGAGAVVAYRPEDVILAGPADAETSAVNRVHGIVEAVVPAGSLLRVRLRSAQNIVLTALLTRRSAESLGVVPGADVTAQIKAAALHAWPRADHASKGNAG